MLLCGLTLKLTRAAEASGVRPGCDHATTGEARPYTACRSGSGLSAVVRPHAKSPARPTLLEVACPVACGEPKRCELNPGWCASDKAHVRNPGEKQRHHVRPGRDARTLVRPNVRVHPARGGRCCKPGV